MNRMGRDACKENDIIYMANFLLLVLLLCVADKLEKKNNENKKSMQIICAELQAIKSKAENKKKQEKLTKNAYFDFFYRVSETTLAPY